MVQDSKLMQKKLPFLISCNKNYKRELQYCQTNALQICTGVYFLRSSRCNCFKRSLEQRRNYYHQCLKREHI